MDFQSLNRRELQSLCKINKIPANITNIAMADALKSLGTVVGIDEILNSSCSETATDIEITSPRVPCTGCRTSTWKKAKKSETESLLATASRASRGVRRQLAGEVDDFLKTPSVTNAKKEGTTTTTRKNNVNRETTVQRVYNTRRSARLTEKKCLEPGVTEREISQPVKIASLMEEEGELLEKSVGSGSSSIETSHESNISFEDNIENNIGEGSVENCHAGILKAKVQGICVEFEKLEVVTVDENDQNSVSEKVNCCESMVLEENQKVEEKFILNELGVSEEKKDEVDNIKSNSDTSNSCEDEDIEENLIVVDEKFDLHVALNVSVDEHDVCLAQDEHFDSLLCEKILTEADGSNANSISCDTENPSNSSESVSEMKNGRLDCNYITNNNENSRELSKLDNLSDYVTTEMTAELEGIEVNILKNTGSYPLETSHESNISFENTENNVWEGSVENCNEDILKAKVEGIVIVDGSDHNSLTEKVYHCGENPEDKHKVEDKFIQNELETSEEKSDLVENVKLDSEGTSNPCEDEDSREKLTMVDEKIVPCGALNVSLKENDVYLALEEHSDSLFYDEVLSDMDDSNVDSISVDIDNPSNPSGSVLEIKNEIDSYEVLTVPLKEHNVYLAPNEHPDGLVCDIVLTEVKASNADYISCYTKSPSDFSGSVSEMKNEVLECSVDEVLVNPKEQELSKNFETSEEAQESLTKETAVDIIPTKYQETKETVADADKATHESVPDVIDHPPHLTSTKNQTLSKEMSVGKLQVVTVEDAELINKKVEDEKPITLNETSMRQLKKQLKALSIKNNINADSDDKVSE